MLGRFPGGLVSDSRGGGGGNPGWGVEGPEHLDGGLRLPGYLRRGGRRGGPSRGSGMLPTIRAFGTGPLCDPGLVRIFAGC
jgi:hypothetical protein